MTGSYLSGSTRSSVERKGLPLTRQFAETEICDGLIRPRSTTNDKDLFPRPFLVEAAC